MSCITLAVFPCFGGESLYIRCFLSKICNKLVRKMPYGIWLLLWVSDCLREAEAQGWQKVINDRLCSAWLWRSVKWKEKSSVISFTGSFLSFFTPFHPLSHPDRNFLIPGSVLTCCCPQELTRGGQRQRTLLTYNWLNGKATSLAWKIESKLRTLEWKFGMIYWVLIENSVRPMPAPNITPF